MQIGICHGEIDTTACAEAGYDYVEHPAARTLRSTEADADWPAIRDRILAAPLPTPVVNQFFPGDVKLVGPERDLDAAVDYVGILFDRVKSIGGEVQVFGSGAARRIPEGYPREKAVDELTELLARIAPMAEAQGIRIAMEHLRSAECNVLTTLRETLDFVGRVNHPAVGVLLDGFHLAQMNEPLESIDACGDRLLHVHMADPESRLNPARANSDLRPMFARLKKIGYDGRVSLECGWEDPAANMRPSRDLVALQWAEA